MLLTFAAGHPIHRRDLIDNRAQQVDAHPAYSDFTDMRNWNDVGVVVLDTPTKGIFPSKIAPVGTLYAIGQSNLSKSLFTVVGYGIEVP